MNTDFWGNQRTQSGVSPVQKQSGTTDFWGKNRSSSSIATSVPKPTPTTTATPFSDKTIGASTQKDTSGKPFLTYNQEIPQTFLAPKQTVKLTDTTRVATPFDPRVAQKLDKNSFYNQRAVANRAALKTAMGGTYSDELDHKIALELSGSNQPSNLQIQPGIKGGAAAKSDTLENTLAKSVADGQISLFDAQRQLAQEKGLTPPWTGNNFNTWDKLGNWLMNQPDLLYGANKIQQEILHPFQNFDENGKAIVPDIKNVPKDLVEPLVGSLTAIGNAIGNVYKSYKGTPAEAVGSSLQLGASVLGAGATAVAYPIISITNALKDIPVLNAAGKALSVPFEAAGVGAKALTRAFVDELPLNQNDKNAILSGAEPLGEMLSQLGLGLGMAKAIGKDIAKKSKEVSITPEDTRTNLSPYQDKLMQEARKYKSADEFVKAQGETVYRGGKPLDISKINEEGLPVTFDNKVAEQFARSKNQFAESPAGQIMGYQKGKNIVESYQLSRTAKIATRSDIPDSVFNAYKESNPLTKADIAEPIITKWAKENGFDAIDFRTLGKTSAKEAEIKVLNPDILKTKYQLTDIWNKSNETQPRNRITPEDTIKIIEKNISKEPTKLPELPVPKDTSIKASIPGGDYISNFITKDVVPVGEKVLAKVSDVKDSVLKLFKSDPTTDTIKSSLASSLSKAAQLKDMTWNLVEQRKLWWDRVSSDIQSKFIDQIQRGLDITGYGDKTSVLKDMAKEYRARLEKVYADEQKAGIEEGYRENYFPQQFENPNAAKTFFDNLQRKVGMQSFQRMRYFDLLKQAIDSGLKPRTTNPEEMVINREFSSFQATAMKEFLDSMRNQGILKITKQSEIPEGYKPINIATNAFYPKESGIMSLPESGANVVNNHFSPSLWSNPNWYGSLYRTSVGLKNIFVPIKLGLSAFHAISTGFSDMTFQTLHAINTLASGDISGFGREFLMIPVSPFKDVLSAGDIIDAWYKGAKTDVQREAIDIMKRGGYRVGLSNEWKSSFNGKMNDAVYQFKTDNPIGGFARLAPAMIDMIQKPLIEWWVPRIKAISYLRAAQDFISSHPDMSDVEINKNLFKIEADTSNFFGQMVNDNLFLKRYVRDILTGSSLSLGWNLGTIRAGVGGIVDTASYVKDIVSGNKTELSNRAKLAMIYPLVVGAFGGLLNYALSKQPPQSLIDYYYPKTGKKNPDGSDERISIPSMMKEPFAISSRVKESGALLGSAEYIGGKAAPLFSTIIDVLQNKDFYGTEIVNPYDPMLQKTWDAANFLITENSTPISISAYKKEGGVLPFLGFAPAPSYITQTKGQAEIFKLYDKRFSGGTQSKESREIQVAKQDIRVAYLSGDNKKTLQLLQQAIKNGYIKEMGVGTFVNSLNIPGDIRAYERFDAQDQKSLLSTFSKSELERYVWYTKPEVLAKFSTISKDAQSVVNEIKSGKLKEPVWNRQKNINQ